jgi:2-dehydro-3-deoxyphosphogalactonate aldolase
MIPNPSTPTSSVVADRFAAATGAHGLPLVAILRGLPPADALRIVDALLHAGFTLIEVPLNSPQPLASIALLVEKRPQALVGAGTVLTVQQVREVHAAGGQLVVAPNFDAAVVAEALGLGMVCLPGVMTPSEAFAALAAGASGLKLFPAEVVTPAAVKAMRAVLPADALLLPVGGIAPASMTAYRAAGASGFGLGSALYKPGDGADAVALHAAAFVRAWRGG